MRSNLKKYLCPIYIMDKTKTNFYKFRLDIEGLKYSSPSVLLYRLFSKNNSLSPGILGVEIYNKYGETIKEHIHYHFSSTEKIDTMRKRFIRSWADDGISTPNYSLKEEKDVVDLKRFYRYPLKQYDPDTFEYKFEKFIPFPEDFDIKVQNLLAWEEWNKGKIMLSAHVVKRDSRLTVYERIIQKVEEENKIFSDVNEIRYYIFDYYMDNKFPLQKQRIIEMADSLAVIQKIISRENYFK